MGKKNNWITFNLESLYPSIPDPVALVALRFHLYTNSQYSEDLKEFIHMVTNYLMTHNFFKFDKTFYVQNKGVSMGQNVPPHSPI